ncbi:MAG: hypothetical protein WA399_02930 [Acidobacteriaceae bacterium]
MQLYAVQIDLQITRLVLLDFPFHVGGRSFHSRISIREFFSGGVVRRLRRSKLGGDEVFPCFAASIGWI